MNQRILIFYLLFLLLLQCSPSSSPEKNDLKILSEAFFAGHLTVVRSSLEDIKKERELSKEEEVLYSKSLFYLGEWKEFFFHWTGVPDKTPELILLYFKAVLVSQLPVTVSPEDESKLIELLAVSPEACLLYLKFNKIKTKEKQRKLFLAQWKQFQTQVDRLQKELGGIK